LWVWLLFGNAVDSNVRICLQDGQPSTSGFRILSDIQLVSDADPNPYVGIVWDDGDVQARLAKCMRCAALLKVPVGNLRIRDAEKACWEMLGMPILWSNKLLKNHHGSHLFTVYQVKQHFLVAKQG